MEVLKSAPNGKPVELVFIDPKSITKGPATLAVNLPDGNSMQIKCLKGQVLRSVLLDAKIDLYDMKGKLSNCGGGDDRNLNTLQYIYSPFPLPLAGGICGTCVVGVSTPGFHFSILRNF